MVGIGNVVYLGDDDYCVSICMRYADGTYDEVCERVFINLGPPKVPLQNQKVRLK